MQTKINSLIKTKVGWERVTIFGYSNRSVPGLDIQGLGSHGRNMKEKFIFICKERKISFPFKRYILCVDLSEIKTNLEKDSITYLELPLLMVFFYLGGFLPIRTLEDCLSVGHISVAGKIFEPEIPMDKFDDLNLSSFKLIINNQLVNSQNLKTIPTKDILSPVSLFDFRD